MNKDEERKIHYNVLQLVVACVGSVLLLSIIGYLGYQIVEGNGKPPNLKITASLEPNTVHTTFKVIVENTGQKTAKSVNVQFAFVQKSGKGETSTLTFDYVPAKSKEEGWVVFYNDSGEVGKLKVLSANYLKP